jgi:hypothetical protein
MPNKRPRGPQPHWCPKRETLRVLAAVDAVLDRPADAQGKFTDADAVYGPGYVRTHALYLTRNRPESSARLS